MKATFVRIEEAREAGYSNDGEKITILGQIYDFQEFNGICVIKAEKDDQNELVFMELNNTSDNVNQIEDEEVISELKELWRTTETINKVAEKFNIGKAN